MGLISVSISVRVPPEIRLEIKNFQKLKRDVSEAPIKMLQLLDCLKRHGLQAKIILSHSDTGQREPNLQGLQSRLLSPVESNSIRLPMVHTVKMGVLMRIGTIGKVKLAKYESSPRAIEPIYSL